VQASNSWGKAAASLSITIGAQSDTQPPTVSITAPKAGKMFASGSQVTLQVAVSDNVGVVRVQYTLDGVSLGSAVTTAPFSMVWTAPSRGGHTLTAKAWDAAGNSAVSAPVSFRVH
jgi:hypothetical protein